MNTTATRIVLDTNVLIAIIGKKSPFWWIFDAIIDGKLILCVSTSILLEYREVLARKNGFAVAENILNFLAVHPFVEHYEIYFAMKTIPNDPDDDKFVDCAFASGSILITNDGHFEVLRLIDFPEIAFLNLQEFAIWADENAIF